MRGAWWWLACMAAAGSALAQTTVECDIVILGGSTASLAAAITAAEADPSLSVCFTEITDWPGGQMSSGGVPAIDFGPSNDNPAVWPASFADAMNWIGPNPGACSVSTECYLPNAWVDGWVFPRLARSPNLRVFLRTVVSSTARDSGTGEITSVTVIQRTPRNASQEWSQLLSTELPDWYSASDSSMFTKQVFELEGKVFVEATELGDVLLTAGLPFAQGIESPNETDFTTQSTCGQAWTLTFYLERLAEAPANPTPVPPGSDEGEGWPDPASFDWYNSWSWRRSWCNGNCSLVAANVGDVTQQNLGNDLDAAYVLLSSTEAAAQKPWQGGVNLTVLSMLEQRAYGWATYMISNAPDPSWVNKTIVLNYTTPGTLHGLSKFPYVRDTRRSVGWQNFRLFYAPLDYFNASNPSVGYVFPDVVALGNYNMDTHRLTSCVYPDYLNNHTTLPYTIPMRALLVQNAPNLLVAGKTMSQTFHANGAVRLHPSEWTSGVAAGGMAVYMLQHALNSTLLLLNDVAGVQAFLNSSAVGQPLQWVTAPPPPPQIGYVCGLGVCFGVDKTYANYTLYANATCDGNCPPIAADQWLANMDYWMQTGNNITAQSGTYLKKATTMSSALPPSEILAVEPGFTCTLVTDAEYPEGYKLCTVPS